MDRFYKKMMDEYKEDQKKKLSKEGKKTLLDIFLEQLDFRENKVIEQHIQAIIYISNSKNINLYFES